MLCTLPILLCQSRTVVPACLYINVVEAFLTRISTSSVLAYRDNNDRPPVRVTWCTAYQIVKRISTHGGENLSQAQDSTVLVLL